MALTRFQNTEEIMKDIKLLASQLENLRKLYEQYFLGLIREEPSKLRTEVQGLVNKHFGVPIQNASLKFQLQQCVSRYNTYSTYWDRILREMEEGTYKRDVFKTNLHEKVRKEKTGPVPAVKDDKPKDMYESLFDEYKQLRQQLKQDIKGLSLDTFKKQLKAKIGELEEKGEKFSFKVVQDNKEIKIKLQKKKAPTNE